MSIRPQRLSTLVFLGVGLAVVLATYGDYGVTWDEPVQAAHGEGVLRYFASGFQDRSVDELLFQRFYGPLFELTAALAYAPVPGAKYEVRHLLNALTALLGVWGVIRLASRLPGRAVVWLAPLALVALPRFYGHAFNNSKDAPFACAFVWAVDAMCRFAAPPAPGWERWRGAVLCGLGIGVPLAIRPGGLPLVLLLFGCITAYAVATRRDFGAARLRDWTGRAAVAVAVAWTLMVALWPWAHQSPIGNPVRTALAALSSPFVYPVLFEGAVTPSDELPAYYLVKYLMITTPPPLLVLAALGLGLTVRDVRRAPEAPASLVSAAAGLWLVLPVALASVSRPNVYDGIRHVLFVLPALALLAARGGAWAVGRLERAIDRHGLRDTPLRHAALAAVLVAVASPLVWHVRLHPYQSTYFNAFVGGLRGADGRYETDYWLSSYREAMGWVNERALREGRELTVLVAADPYSADCAGVFAGPGVTLVRIVERDVTGALPESFDYYLATTRYGLDGNFPDSPVVHRVGRAGATFSVIRGRPADSERSLAGS